MKTFPVHQCICGHYPQTTIIHKNQLPSEYLTRCHNCNVVYVNGPSKSIEHSLEMWNSFYTESVKMILQKAIVQLPTFRDDLLKICGRSSA